MLQVKHPSLKQRHTDILLLLYRFRYLTRPQIQSFLNLKSHSKTIQWLNELTKLQHLIKYDRTSVIAPAVYSLSKLSRKYLKDNRLVKQPIQLNRVWRETSYSAAFRDKCVLVANIYFSLLTQASKKEKLTFSTKAELYGIENMIVPAPDAYVVIEKQSEKTRRFFLDALTNVPTKALRGRVRQYVDYFEDSEWQGNTDKPFPEIIIVCPSRPSARNLSRYIREECSDEPDLRFRVASSDRALTDLLPKKKA